MKKLLATTLFFLSLFFAWTETDTTTSAETMSFPDIDYNVTLNPGIGFSMDVLKLPALRFDPSLVMYANIFGDTLSMFWIQADMQYAQGYWFYTNDGRRIDPYGTDANSAIWRQWNLFGNLIYRQGLVPGKDLQDTDILTFVSMYSARWFSKIKEQSPGAYIFKSDRPDAVNNILQNRLSASLELRMYESSKLYNTRKGTAGDITFEAVPKKFGNDLLGLSDFYSMSGNIRNYIPITKGKDFSMYACEALSYDVGWGDFMPITDSYGSPNACPVRGSFLYDATMHMSHNLELRMSFPDLIDFGVMPGFNLFYDCGIFDNYDYRFHTANFMQSAGLAFVMHMDSFAITPVSYQLDLQFGATYDITNKAPAFWFSIFFPGPESQI